MTVINQVKRLRAGFPNAQPGFYDLVIERAKAKGFTDQQLIDAVSNLIDTHRYPQPLVSDVISWDKRIKLYTHSDMVKKSGDYGAGVWDQYKAIRRNGRTFWIEIAEAEQYGIDIDKL